MAVFKTCVTYEGYEEGAFFLVDTIQHLGSWWLVATWLISNKTGERVPERIIRLTGLSHQEVNDEDYRFLLNIPLPKSVFDGAAQDGFVVAIYQALAPTPKHPKRFQ